MLPLHMRHISVDLWDTILRRRCHPDEVKLHTAQRMLHLLGLDQVSDPTSTMELFRMRQGVEADIGSRRQEQGLDDEYEIEEVLARCVLESAVTPPGKEKLSALVENLVQGEIAQEIAVTYLDEDLVDHLSSCSYESLHVLSDFYMAADKIQIILEAHDFPFKVDNFFLSCDANLNKRSGRLYQHVCSALDVEPEEILHIGDNLHVDVEMAHKSGLKAFHFVGEKGELARRQNQGFFTLRDEVNAGRDSLLLSRKEGSPFVFADKGGEREKLRSYGGYLSPFFVGFALFIQELCATRGHQKVYFFTREGKFFQRVFDLVQAHNLFSLPKVESCLLPVSRLATFFPSVREITRDEMMRLWSQYHTQSVNSFLGSLGINPEECASVIRKNSIDADEMIPSPWQDERFLRLFQEQEFLEFLRTEHTARREDLLEYFQEVGFGKDGKAFVVDIGWRGTIQDNLALIFPDVEIEGCYLGLQDFFNPQPANVAKYGYIADSNLGEDHPMLKHVMPFEMLSFGTGGTTVGYHRESSGTMVARFQCDQTEDRIHNERIHYFQAGVLSEVDRVCRTVDRHGISIQELRNEARVLATRLLTSPPKVLCRAFNALRQDDTFGMARTVLPADRSFRLSDRLLVYFSASRRERFLSDLEGSYWPQCLLRTRYLGIFHKLGKWKKRLITDGGMKSSKP